MDAAQNNKPASAEFEIADLSTTGLLWLINRVVFHPRGFALSLVVEEDGTASRWQLLGDGREIWWFDPKSEDGAEGHFAAALHFLSMGDATATNPEDGMPLHLPMPLTAAGQGPANHDDAVKVGCWCSDPACELWRRVAQSEDLKFDRELRASL